MPFRRKNVVVFVLILLFCGYSFGQKSAATRVELGSATARNGFKNEDEIRDKFNNWKSDEDAKVWLATMNHKVVDILSLIAIKPHGEKSDVQVTIRTKSGEFSEGISIKLVSSPTGFNQIDKRRLIHYVSMWKIPTDVETALKLFVGETPPNKPSRAPNRMFLDELTNTAQKAIIDFFTANRKKIVSDLFKGEGQFDADWVMVALKSTDKTRWVLRTDADTIHFFSEGKVELTRNGNLKIGRITMQRKGGDGGRDTAKMLQFKINPALLFEAK